MYWTRVCVALLCVCYVSSVTVRTSLGEVEGGFYYTTSGKQVFTFFGLPYAEPPVGSNRFKEPKPAKVWSGIRSGKTYGPSCVQYATILPEAPNKINGDEDCLYLNIFTPRASNTSALPVLVYFHGGGFMYGSTRGLKPDFLLDVHDIIFVTVHYRLGPFGFLSTEDDTVPGNNGLKDQVHALKWLKENIEFFGGDSRNVTISGNSAGGASVQFHFLSPLSRGLFQRGISSSGSALMPWTLVEEPLQKAKLLADSLSCPTNNTKELVNCLKEKSSTDILSKIEPLFTPWLCLPFTTFGPVIEVSSENAFISEHPYQRLVRGEVFQGPWLTSITTEEGLFPAASFIDREEWMESLNKNWLEIAPHLLDYNFTVPHDKINYVSDEIRNYYLGNDNITVATRDKVVEMVGDRHFKVDMDLAVKAQASVSLFPVFFFTFGYRGSVSLSDVMSKTKANFGVSHFDDIYCALVVDDSLNRTQSDIAMIRTISNIWASFIVTGVPSPGQNIQWDPVPRDSAVSGNITYLMIESNEDMKMKVDENYGNRQFWLSLRLRENTNYY